MKKPIQDPYHEIIDQFNRRGIRYVVIGMSGINYYSKTPAETFGTADYDIFLEPTLENVKRALGCLKKMRFSIGAAGKILDEKKLHEIVRGQRTLVATTPYGIMVELLLRVSGYPFSELAKDAVTFDLDGVPVKVGRLSKLLQSKRAAGRPKDRAFLKRYQSLLEEPPH